MTRKPDSVPQHSRDQSRTDHDTRRSNENQQDFSRRDVKHGTQRSETQTESGQRHDDAGNLTPDPGLPEHERGDAKRPYKRAGH